MTTDNEENIIPNVVLTDKEVKPNFSLSARHPNTPVFAADFAVVLGDVDAHQCTFTFFRKHPTMKLGEGNTMMLEGIEEEPFLEIKMPLEVTMGLALYMSAKLNELRKNPNQRGITFFGPSGMKQQ